jgi:hypothetical protein
MKEVLFKDVKVGGTFRFGLGYADMVKLAHDRYAHRSALDFYAGLWRGVPGIAKVSLPLRINPALDLSNLPCDPEEKVFSEM